MAINRGKAFETKFKEDWAKAFPKTFVYRIPDQMSGYKQQSSNPCDFICFTGRLLFLIEAKVHKGNTFPFSNLRQYDKLIQYKDSLNTYPGVVLWFIEHDTVIWCSIKDIERMKLDGKKSINIKMLHPKSDEVDYNLYEIPSKKKRVFMDSDYSKLEEFVENGKCNS